MQAFANTYCDCKKKGRGGEKEIEGAQAPWVFLYRIGPYISSASVGLYCILFLDYDGSYQRQTGISVSYRKYQYQGSWYLYQSRSRDFLSLGINIGIDPEAGAFFARSWQNSY